MRDAWLGSKRGEWVAYLKAVDREKKARRYGGSAYDDGMCHGIIPFGAVHHWRHEAERRQAEILLRPLLGRVLSADEMGAALAVMCPYCGGEHRHWMIADVWDPERPVEARCGKGPYRIKVVGG